MPARSTATRQDDVKPIRTSSEVRSAVKIAYEQRFAQEKKSGSLALGMEEVAWPREATLTSTVPPRELSCGAALHPPMRARLHDIA